MMLRVKAGCHHCWWMQDRADFDGHSEEGHEVDRQRWNVGPSVSRIARTSIGAIDSSLLLLDDRFKETRLSEVLD